MRVEARVDAGPVLLQRRSAIGSEEDAGALTERLALLGADVLAEGLALLAQGRGVWAPQDEAQATYAPKIGDRDRLLPLEGSPAAIVNRVRALSPAPGAYLRLAGGGRLKVFRAQARADPAPAALVAGVEAGALVLGTGPASVALLEVQPEGKRRMTGAEFARGLRLRAGDRLAGGAAEQGGAAPRGAGGTANGMAPGG